MRIVFDLDDTISVHRNRDYANATPVCGVIEKMRRIRSEMPEVQIVILTARGMASCNGDANLAEAKNRPVLEEWLARNGVPYDEIIFGKPLGDAYVDDKAVSAEEFSSWGCARLHGGFSGNPVTRVGTIVVKQCPNAQDVADWYTLAHAYGGSGLPVSFPKLISHQLGKLYLRYEEGVPLSDMDADAIVRGGYLDTVREAVLRFGEFKHETRNDVDSYFRYIEGRCAEIGVEADRFVKPLFPFREMLEERTFHHGDFSTMNLIRRNDGSLCAIDPNPKGDVKCWMIDAAKFYASLCGLEAVLRGADIDANRAMAACRFLEGFPGIKAECIIALARTLVIRVAYYAHKRGEGHIVSRILEEVKL